MARLETAITDLAHLDPQKRSPLVHSLREKILDCAVSGVAETLELPASSLYASLLTLTDSTPRKMRVVARSDSRRTLSVEYDAVDAFLPWRVVNRGTVEIEENYKEREGLGARRYRSIFAIPVTKDSGAAGTLSIDCTIPYAFNGRTDQVYYQVRPYVALLALTFPPSGPYHECFLNPAHFQ